ADSLAGAPAPRNVGSQLRQQFRGGGRGHRRPRDSGSALTNDESIFRAATHLSRCYFPYCVGDGVAACLDKRLPATMMEPSSQLVRRGAAQAPRFPYIRGRERFMNVTNFIGGEPVPAASGAWLDKVAPASGEVIARVVDSDSRDVENAVAAAVRAFPAWARTPAAERSRLLMELARRIDERLDELAR